MDCDTKVCPRNKICNPKTRRCVLKSGRLGRKILKTPKCEDKICEKKKMCNPKTGRCVLKAGKIGMEIIGRTSLANLDDLVNLTPGIQPLLTPIPKLGAIMTDYPQIIKVRDLEFIRRHSRGDGSCFFNSIVQQLYTIPKMNIRDPSYRSGRNLRVILARSLDISDFVEVQGGHFATLKVGRYIDWPLKQQYSEMNIIEIAADLEDSDPETVERIIKTAEDAFVKFVEKFDSNAWANEAMIEITSKKLGVNILVIPSNNLDNVYSVYKINPLNPFIFVYNIVNAHYEPMFGRDGKAVYSYEEVKDIVKNINY